MFSKSFPITFCGAFCMSLNHCGDTNLCLSSLSWTETSPGNQSDQLLVFSRSLCFHTHVGDLCSWRENRPSSVKLLQQVCSLQGFYEMQFANVPKQKQNTSNTSHAAEGLGDILYISSASPVCELISVMDEVLTLLK